MTRLLLLAPVLALACALREVSGPDLGIGAGPSLFGLMKSFIRR